MSKRKKKSHPFDTCVYHIHNIYFIMHVYRTGPDDIVSAWRIIYNKRARELWEWKSNCPRHRPPAHGIIARVPLSSAPPRPAAKVYRSPPPPTPGRHSIHIHTHTRTHPHSHKTQPTPRRYPEGPPFLAHNRQLPPSCSSSPYPVQKPVQPIEPRGKSKYASARAELERHCRRWSASPWPRNVLPGHRRQRRLHYNTT